MANLKEEKKERGGRNDYPHQHFAVHTKRTTYQKAWRTDDIRHCFFAKKKFTASNLKKLCKWCWAHFCTFPSVPRYACIFPLFAEVQSFFFLSFPFFSLSLYLTCACLLRPSPIHTRTCQLSLHYVYESVPYCVLSLCQYAHPRLSSFRPPLPPSVRLYAKLCAYNACTLHKREQDTGREAGKEKHFRNRQEWHMM